VHAPVPSQIAVDCDVNASAGFGSGLTGLFGHTLTLTIGLPLIGGLNAKQLAGIIAHELGHFSQGAGMRLSYVIRSTNAWFARLVYERDNFDETLKDWGEANNIAGAIIYVAYGGIMITRGVLWVLMMTGHILSCFLIRRMEYDADRSEARLVGARVYESTGYRLAILTAAQMKAAEIVHDCWLKDTYPDDFSALVVGLAERMSDRDRDDAECDLVEETTGLFDDHPSFSDRLASVQLENAKGVFRLDLPATDIFRAKPKLAEAASLDMYRTILGRGLRPHEYRPAKEYLRRERRDRE
ncbi:MAG TPA: M48 family metallopeptidase, partial [Gemmataceae bacterium]|jgi:hypothetical protein|nr:M48 family metallopeptidase [Gemmataceae bacterium]